MNPSPSLQGALWTGNQQLVTKKQLLSTSTGFYEDLKDFNFSTISVSTLTVPIWVSTPLLYVSDIQGYNVQVSQDLSANTGIFQITNVSVMQMTFKPTFTGNIQVTFDLGLGEAIGGFLAGLGAAVGGALIGVGTGAGLAIQGAEQGIATMIAGRPQNFITNNTYETINFTSQLQVSTLGNDFPAYSSIFRTVSSASANTVPGREIFTSTIFYPGQICVRTASDPINLITGDSNLNTSTIQSFGQWVPLAGLEPENIVANSISTNNISSGNASMDSLVAVYAGIQNLTVETLTIPENIPTPNVNKINMGYAAPINFKIGSLGNAAIQGDINYLFMQSDEDIIFTKTGDPSVVPFNARLALGSNANESILTVSSIKSLGFIQANQGYFSSLTVNELTVVSSICTINTVTATNILSTSLVTANLVSTVNLQALYIAPFQFSSLLGNPLGIYDITRQDTVVSTSYDSVSSLTQNLYQASLNIQLQNQANFNIGPGTNDPYYTVTPQNVSQWGSTILVYDNLYSPGVIDLGWVGQWGVTPGDLGNLPGGATFDVLVTNNSQGYTRSLTVSENSNQFAPLNTSTLVQTATAQPGVIRTFRFTLPPVVGGTRNGWWNYVTPAPPPYVTSNNNTFQIYQDINDSYIKGTDRLHIQAGDIFLDGTVSYSNQTVQTLNASNINAQTETVGSLSSLIANISTIYTDQVFADSRRGGIDSSHYKSTSYTAAPTFVTPFTATFQTTSSDFLPQFNLVSPVYGNNYFTSYNVVQWNNSVWVNSVPTSLGPPKVLLDDLNNELGPYQGSFWIQNTIAQAIPIIQIIPSVGYSNIGLCAGNTVMKLTTTNSGTGWTLQSNVPNPQGVTSGIFSNQLTVTQQQTITQIVNNQEIQVQAPTTTLTTGNFNMNADQIRVLSHAYGSAPETGLPSYPIGIEFGMYIDPNMVFTFQGDFFWNSDATNVLYNVTGQIFYDVNAWNCMVIPNRFRTDTYALYEFDVEPYIFNVQGGGFCWGYSRYILVNGAGDGPDGASSYVGYIMIPKNYCTFV